MELREITAGEIMSTDLTTTLPQEKLSIAEIMMLKKNVGGLPVVNEKKELVGIITQRDIQFAKFSGIGVGEKVFKVDDLMTKNPIVCKPNDKLPVIVKKMNQHNIERIPIVDDGNRLVGIVVMKDIIHTLNNALESGI